MYDFSLCVGSGQWVLQPQLWQSGLIERQGVRGKTHTHLTIFALSIADCYISWEDGTKAQIKYYIFYYTNTEAWLDTVFFPCSAHSSFCLSHYLHLFFFSLPRTLIWKEGAPLPTQYVLCLPAALSCWTPPLETTLLGKTQGIYTFFYSLSLSVSLLFHRPRRRSILNRPEGGKGKLTPIQRVVKVWLILARHQYNIGVCALLITCITSLSQFSMQGRPPHAGPRSATTLMWVLQQLPSQESHLFTADSVVYPFVFSAKFQGGNGSSPVRGLPSARRSPQNSHSAPGSIVSISLTVGYPVTRITDEFNCRWKWVSVLLQGLTECLCRSGRIAPHLRVCVLGNTIPKPPLASVSR